MRAQEGVRKRMPRRGCAVATCRWASARALASSTSCAAVACTSFAASSASLSEPCELTSDSARSARASAAVSWLWSSPISAELTATPPPYAVGGGGCCGGGAFGCGACVGSSVGGRASRGSEDAGVNCGHAAPPAAAAGREGAAAAAAGGGRWGGGDGESLSKSPAESTFGRLGEMGLPPAPRPAAAAGPPRGDSSASKPIEYSAALPAGESSSSASSRSNESSGFMGGRAAARPAGGGAGTAADEAVTGAAEVLGGTVVAGREPAPPAPGLPPPIGPPPLRSDLAAARLPVPPPTEAAVVGIWSDSSEPCPGGSISTSPSRSDIEMSESRKSIAIGSLRPDLKPPPPPLDEGAPRRAPAAAALPAATGVGAGAAFDGADLGFVFAPSPPPFFAPFFFGALISRSSSSS